jgi:hypothetical protein
MGSRSGVFRAPGKTRMALMFAQYACMTAVISAAMRAYLIKL